jgi:hypothetical protein
MRDAIVIFVAIILAMAIGSYLFFNGTPQFAVPQPQIENERRDGSFVVLAEGESALGIDRRTNYRIMSEAELEELWSLVYGSGGGPQMPNIDFTTNEVIGVFDGSHTSGGYSVHVTRVEDKDGVRTIHIRRESPGENCVISEALTSPFQIVRVSKTLLPITRAEEEVTRECR